MYEIVYKHVVKHGYFTNHKKVLIAVSGGVDSMNLLHFLHSYRKELSLKIAIAHINHRQRLESDVEENYLKKWASDHRIPIFIDYFQGDFSEENAREFRYSFFRTIMKKEGYSALVTAHHADDNAETVLMRFVRGSRLRHLKGISSVLTIPEGEIIRPFLSFQKSDFPKPYHFEDDTNHGLDFYRNRVRNQYIPLFEKENPQFSHHVLQLSQEITELFDALSDLTREINIENREEFLEQSLSVQTFLLQEYVSKFPDLQLSKSHFNQLLHLVRTKANLEKPIKLDYWLILTRDRMTISKIRPWTDEKIETKVLDYGGKISFKNFHFGFETDTLTDGIPIHSKSPITLRPRQSGDKISFDSGSKKLRRLFIDEKLSFEERRKAIVGEQDGEIIFVLAGDKTYLRKSFKNDTIEAKLYIQKEKW